MSIHCDFVLIICIATIIGLLGVLWGPYFEFVIKDFFRNTYTKIKHFIILRMS